MWIQKKTQQRGMKNEFKKSLKPTIATKQNEIIEIFYLQKDMHVVSLQSFYTHIEIYPLCTQAKPDVFLHSTAHTNTYAPRIYCIDYCESEPFIDNNSMPAKMHFDVHTYT